MERTLILRKLENIEKKIERIENDLASLKEFLVEVWDSEGVFDDNVVVELLRRRKEELVPEDEVWEKLGV